MYRARRSASEAKCWKDFERDVAVKPGVMRAIYFAHSARAEQRNHLVRTEATSNSGNVRWIIDAERSRFRTPL